MKNMSRIIFEEVSSINRNTFNSKSKIIKENSIIKEDEEVVDEVPYDDTTKKFCPRCGQYYTKYPALSRYDNETYICPDCGVEEAMVNYTHGKLINPKQYTKDKFTEEVTIENPTSEDLEKDDEASKTATRKEIEDRIAELRKAIEDGVSTDEKVEMEKEIDDLEKQLNESAKVLTEAPEDEEEFDLVDEPTEELPLDEPTEEVEEPEEMSNNEVQDEAEEDKEEVIEDDIEQPFYATVPEFDELREILPDLDYRLFLINDNMVCIGRLNGPDIEFLTSNRPEEIKDMEKSEQNDKSDEIEERAEEDGEDSYEYIWVKAPDTLDKFLNQINVVYLSPEMSDEDKEQYAGIEASHESVMNFLMNELPEDKRDEHEEDEIEDEDTSIEEPIEDFDEEIPNDFSEESDEDISEEDEEEEE